MGLFDIPQLSQDRAVKSLKTKTKTKNTNTTKTGSEIKLKKGQTITDLIIEARKLVEEKLSNYKETSRCVTDIEELKTFFKETEDLIGIDTETTGLNVYSDEIVGFSVSNHKECLYVPLNHKSPIYLSRLPNQIDPEEAKQVLLEAIKEPRYKWIYHNSKFDLRCI